MKIEVSNGEIIDKLTILEIKLEKIDDAKKLKNIRREYDSLKPVALKILPPDNQLYKDLKTVNLVLWKIEDDIRDLERNSDFGPSFIELARSVYKNNDERARIKREINSLTDSDLHEEKSYRNY